MSPSQGECSESDSRRPLQKMKLYLSSFHLGDNPIQLSELFSTNKKIAIIPNAKENLDTLLKEQRMQSELKSLQKIGLQPEIKDLKEFFGNSEKLQEALNTFGEVWVVGGNTFVLRAAMSESGFDRWIQSKLKDKDFVYAGYSAGICVLAPTLQGLDIVDNPQEAIQAYGKEIIWEGLHVLQYSFAPHFRSNHPESVLVEKQVEYFKQHNIPYKTLSDGEVFVTEIEKIALNTIER